MKELWDALVTWMRAQAELDREAEAYKGYSWDYHASTEIRRVEELRDKAGQAMNDYIDTRVREIVSEGKT